jgi:hypothetical protein
MGLDQPLTVYMGVDLSGIDAGMAQKRLHDSEVYTCFQQMSGEGVPKSMRADVVLYTRFQAGFLQDFQKPCETFVYRNDSGTTLTLLPS